MTTPTLTTLLSREILRYEREVWRSDMGDGIRLSFWRTPHAMFYRQCAQAWRNFALEVEKIAQ